MTLRSVYWFRNQRSACKIHIHIHMLPMTCETAPQQVVEKGSRWRQQVRQRRHSWWHVTAAKLLLEGPFLRDKVPSAGLGGAAQSWELPSRLP